MERSHSAVLELELIDGQHGIGLQIAEDASQTTSTRCLSAERNSVEVDKVKDVLNVNVAHLNGNGVALIF